jgi:membrane-associated phospholipid phosphatase
MTAPMDPSTAELRWSRIRRVAGWVYLGLLAVVIVTIGVPTDRGSLLLIVLAGIGVFCLGRGWRSFGRALLDWLPFTAVLIAYDYSRGIADALGMPLHVGDVAAVDRVMFGQVPTVWLQRHFFDAGSPHWYDAVATLVYTTHFLATPLTAAILWVRNRAVWVRFVRRVIALALAGLATYILFPAAPPWYAAREGVIEPVVRASGRGWYWLHINHAGNLLDEGQVASNAVAAMPSLHTAYAAIIMLFVIDATSSRWRWLVIAYPVLMGLALVYLAEHYVIDVVLGVVYAFAVDGLARAWERRHPAGDVSQAGEAPVRSAHAADPQISDTIGHKAGGTGSRRRSTVTR